MKASLASAISAACILTIWTVPILSAQEPQTRADVLREQREAKQREVAPYEPTGLETAMAVAETRVVPLLQRDGVYAKLGSLTTGSGFAYGAGFRDRALVGGKGTIDLWAAGSLKQYWALEARGTYPLLPGGRLTAEGFARRYDYPQEDYFGLGPDARRADRAHYSLGGSTAGAGLWSRLTPTVRIGGNLEYQRPRLGPGGGHTLPSIEDVFGADEPVGFGERANFLRASTFAELDYRQPLNARRGGWYRVDLSRYSDRTGDRFSFTRLDVDLRQYVSVLAERRIFVARAWVSTTDAESDGRVPFYLMPMLGGNSTLRGFRANRFRGTNLILLQGEYRWEIWSALEAALFYDAGKVAMRRSDLDLKSLERDYGFGFRFNTDNGVVMRVDAAFGSRDGKQLHIVFGGFF